MTTPEKNKPAAEVKAGAVIGTIWKNESEKGAYYTVTFARLYKQEEQWKRTETYGYFDLPNLAKAADLAHAKIKELSTTEQAPEQADETA